MRPVTLNERAGSSCRGRDTAYYQKAVRVAGRLVEERNAGRMFAGAHGKVVRDQLRHPHDTVLYPEAEVFETRK